MSRDFLYEELEIEVFFKMNINFVINGLELFELCLLKF